jgi:hypothetical protein
MIRARIARLQAGGFSPCIPEATAMDAVLRLPTDGSTSRRRLGLLGYIGASAMFLGLVASLLLYRFATAMSAAALPAASVALTVAAQEALDQTQPSGSLLLVVQLFAEALPDGNGGAILQVPLAADDKISDVLAKVTGLDDLPQRNTWIERPESENCATILPIDFKGGLGATDYPILPGDRIFVANPSYPNPLTEWLEDTWDSVYWTVWEWFP